MRQWFGMSSKTSAVDSTVGLSAEQTNTRMRTEGELQRRYGFLSTLIARQAGPIRNIVSAYPAGGNYITFDVESAGGGSSEAFGQEPPIPPWRPPKKRRPIIDPPESCTLWGPFNDSGQATPLTVTYNLPADSCAGTLTMIGIEDSGRARGDDYGYSFTVDFDGVNAGGSGCLVNSSSTLAIPPGVLVIDVHVQPACVFPLGTQHGTWETTVTSP